MEKREKIFLFFIPISAIIITLLVIPNLNNYKTAVTYLVISVLIGFGPLFLFKFSQIKKRNLFDKELVFFFEDLVYYLELDYSLNEAIIEICKNNQYSNKKFQKKIERLGKLLKKNLRVEDTFLWFVDSLKSDFLDGYKAAIINCIKENLNMKEFFRTLKDDLKHYLKRKEERKTYSYYSILNTYITYFVFLMLLVLLIKKILPFGIENTTLINVYTSYLCFLIFEQAFLSGFLIGELSLSEFLEGIIHSFNLIGLSYLILVFF